jgi:hypothetical protein
MKTEVMDAVPPPPSPAVVPETPAVPAAKESEPSIEGSVATNVAVINVTHSLNPIEDSMALLGIKSEKDFLGRASDNLYAA